ncbi:tRNA glutamyl-Q(34) synthetase GluQRS [Xanthobacter variabilis]|uniref:tRNA glutamyl-Q(34) synthetase GluQRS n=1 Tax=Xanthobacter variabilis TaxID=3119932 RepID=UPI00374F5194
MSLLPGPFVCRFAPSPNGRLHLGHAFSALLNESAARKARGTFLLRIEDIDTTRCRPQYESGILEDLAWLSIVPDAPFRRQSEHFADYAAALGRLEDMGLVYPAFESRGDILRAVRAREEESGRAHPRDPDGGPLFPFARATIPDEERAARRAAGEPFVLRLDMARALSRLDTPLSWLEARGAPDGPLEEMFADPSAWGDVILARRDVPTSYHLSVVVDDAAQGISHVIRGMDLFHATSVHRLLQHLLRLPPPVYHHHRLILDESGRKLSKSNDAVSLASLREAGVTPDEIRRRLDLPPG